MAYDLTVFKDYDIRGKAEQQLTADLVHDIGRAVADFLPKEGPVAVGRDMRADSQKLAVALIEGLRHQGRDVWDIGLVPTDVIYFAAGHYQDVAGGAIITASHNPGEDDGIKLVGHDAAPIGAESGLLDIKLSVRDGHFKTPKSPGGLIEKDLIDDWICHALSFVDPERIKPFKIAVDAGNGMGGVAMRPLLKKLPQLKAETLYFDLDGTFPNHLANPHDPANLKDLVGKIKRDKLDFGIAFDGDGDRAYLVDETGEPVSSSSLMVLLSRYMLKNRPGSIVMYNALMSRTVPEAIEAAGGKAIRTKVGGAFIKADMRQYGAILAGEHSGHFYFRENYYSDSGLIAALVAMQALSEADEPLSRLVAPYKNYFEVQEINRQVGDIGKVVDLLIHHYEDGQIDLLDGLTVYYKDWWFNLRQSHTEPVIRLNVEADTPKLLQEKTFEVLNIIRSFY